MSSVVERSSYSLPLPRSSADGILAKARSTFDRGERDKLYKQAVRIVVDDAAAVWIYDAVQIRGMSPRVKGYVFSPVGSGGELRTWSLE